MPGDLHTVIYTLSPTQLGAEDVIIFGTGPGLGTGTFGR